MMGLARHPKIRLVLTVAVVASGFVLLNLIIGSPQASADCPTTKYFSGQAFDYCNSRGTDIDAFRFQDATKKATFIAKVKASPAAAFYIDLIIGKPQNRSGGHDYPSNADVAEFERRVNNPTISIREENSASLDIGCNNSMKIGGDYAFICETLNYNSVVLYNNKNGDVYTIIKIDCGNPLNDTPLPASDNPPTGSVQAICDPSGTGLVRLNFSDPDGNTSAKLTVYYAIKGDKGHTSSYSTSGRYTMNIGDPKLVAGDWLAVLVVNDRGGNQSRTYKSPSQSCNKDPVGSESVPKVPGSNPGGAGTVDSCSTVGLAFYDPNTPKEKLAYYLSVNDQEWQLYPKGGGQGAPIIYKDVTSLKGFNYWGKNKVVLIVTDAQTGGRSIVATTTLRQCGSVSCGSYSPSNFTVGVDNPLKVSMNIIGAPVPPPGATFDISVTGPNRATYSRVPGTGSPTVTSQARQFNPSTSAVYQISWTYYGKTCPGSTGIAAGYKPYFSVLGGDIAAGPGFSSGNAIGCSGSSSSANITASNTNNYNDAPPVTGNGAGALIAALTTGDMTGFTSGLGYSASNTQKYHAHALSFANTGNGVTANGIPSDPSYGGQFKTTAGVSALPCVYDYGANQPIGLPGIGSSATGIASVELSASVSAGQTKSYAKSLTAGFVTIGSGADSINDVLIPAGSQLTVYVKGNVYIASNIKYASYSNLKDIPRFNLYVKGNVYVAPDVTNLQGVYIVQKNGASGGTLATCATLTGITLDPAMCSKPLTFTGAVAADSLSLDRTLGNLVPDPAKGVPAVPAETFIYSPEVWLSGASKPSLNYQSITSLPPVL